MRPGIRAAQVWNRLSGYLRAVALLAISFQIASRSASASPLSVPGGEPFVEISVARVPGLELAGTFRTGNPHGHAGSPTVAGDTLFLMTPFPHALFALDLTKPGLPVRWSFRPKPDGTAEGLACCDTVNAGPTVSGDQVFITTLDGHTIALNAAGGEMIWDAATAKLAAGETLTASPLAADGKVFVGNAGDDYGARGWIAALDPATGHELWRRFSTGPDADVGIGPGFAPLHAGDRALDLGEATWSAAGWEHGGGSVSGPILYDPDLHLVLHGTGHPAPWNPDQHPGDNKWTSGLFARDAGTGEARWFDQINAHDLFALGSTSPNLIVDREWHGAPRKLLIHPDPNGYVYVLDRQTGEMLSAAPFTTVNATRGVDIASGTLQRDDNRASRFQTTTRVVCPGWPGAVGGASALSADGDRLFIPVSRLCMDMEARNTTFIAGTAFVGANIRAVSPPDGLRGALVGWDVGAGKAAWTIPEKFPVAGGVLALPGGVVFYGTLEGIFKAVDGRDGRELWRFQASSGIIGQPIAYRGPDGRPYVAVLAGLGGVFGKMARPGIDKRDATAAFGMANALQDLPEPADPSGTLYVFGLP